MARDLVMMIFQKLAKIEPTLFLVVLIHEITKMVIAAEARLKLFL
jgi:hypothetical protein